jgi:sugar lactone lactonase YvrE
VNQVQHLLSVQCEVGETPIWIPDEQALYWIDIEGPRVHRYTPADGQTQAWDLDMPITALARRTGGRWILATKTGLAFWDQQANECEFIVDPTADQPDLRFNDTAVDRQGRLLAGTLNQKQFDAPDGAIYRLDADRSIHTLDTGLAVANGIGFTRDGKTVYVTDMFHSRILVYDYDTDAGTVANRRTFVDVPPDAGFPDGLIVDADDHVWSAHWAGWRVTRYDPQGQIEREIKMPVANATCMGFGGPEMDELFITTAWFLMSDEDRQAQPQAGDLFSVKTDVRGLVEPEFVG